MILPQMPEFGFSPRVATPQSHKGEVNLVSGTSAADARSLEPIPLLDVSPIARLP